MRKIEDPAFDYDQYGKEYSGYRQADMRIADLVQASLGDAQIILNVGAGAGSYEPAGRYVFAVEPSAEMRRQRLAGGKIPAINAKAGSLPFDDDTFDASMAMVTVHHWPDIDKGLKEVKRVTKGPVIIMTFDPDALDNFWNAAYFPELIAIEKARYPAIAQIRQSLGGECAVIPVPVPLDCTDGFQEAFYGRPEAFLNKKVRMAQSAWGFLEEGQEDILVQRLADDLASGEWDRKYGHYRTMPAFTCALRLVVSDHKD